MMVLRWTVGLIPALLVWKQLWGPQPCYPLCSSGRRQQNQQTKAAIGMKRQVAAAKEDEKKEAEEAPEDPNKVGAQLVAAAEMEDAPKENPVDKGTVLELKTEDFVGCQLEPSELARLPNKVVSFSVLPCKSVFSGADAIETVETPFVGAKDVDPNLKMEAAEKGAEAEVDILVLEAAASEVVKEATLMRLFVKVW
ncbi:hypothetical protein U1Q18_050457 [Sarracenia purpurea var. burkii]